MKIGETFLTAKFTSPKGNELTLNVQAGSPGISLPEEFSDLNVPEYVRVGIEGSDVTDSLKFEGFSEWLEIYSDVLFVESVKRDVIKLRLRISLYKSDCPGIRVARFPFSPQFCACQTFCTDLNPFSSQAKSQEAPIESVLTS